MNTMAGDEYTHFNLKDYDVTLKAVIGVNTFSQKHTTPSTILSPKGHHERHHYTKKVISK